MTRVVVYAVSLALTVACKFAALCDAAAQKLTHTGTAMTIASIAMPRWVSYSPVSLPSTPRPVVG